MDTHTDIEGLYRTTLAGPGRSLAEAFSNLERSAQVERVLRHAARDILCARVTLKREEGRGYYELTRIRDDFYIILSNYIFKNPRFEIVPGDGLVQFNYKVSGDLNYGVSPPGPLRFNRPGLHVWRQPQGVEMQEWVAPSAHERMVSISVRPEFLAEHFLEGHVEVPARLQAFLQPSGERIDYWQVPLTADMLEITTQLIDNPYHGVRYLINVEALTLQLLCATVENLIALPEQPAEEYTERELRSLADARQRLMKQLSAPPGLRKIARSVGMTEKTLTRAFRTVYGESPAHFNLRCRMQEAMTVLRDKQGSVDQASEAAGYAHPTSFTAAFRRYFGMRPIDVKRLKSG